MNIWGYEKKYKSIKELLRTTDERIEGLVQKKARLIQAKQRCGDKIKELKKKK